MSVAWVGAGIAAVGTVSTMSANKSAQSSQEAGANQANATERYQYDTTRADNAPFRDTGVAANNRLSYLLGLSKNSGAPGAQGGSLTNNRLVETINGTPAYNSTLYNTNPAYKKAWDDELAYQVANWGGPGYNQNSNPNFVEDGLRQRLAGELEKEKAAAAASPAENDPAYGSLMRNFSASDLNADPVYQSGLQFGLDEGTKGINRMAAASGNSLSGATLKALTRLGNDYGSTKANESFNRFNVNRDSTYNKLAGLSGAGQQATNQVSAAGQNMANNVSQNQIGVGNARAASAIGQANGINNSLSQGYNMYQNNQLMNRLLPQQYGAAQQPGVTSWNSQG